MTGNDVIKIIVKALDHALGPMQRVPSLSYVWR